MGALKTKAVRFVPEKFMSAVTLRQMRYFVATAESGKASLAASMVAISPSAVTEAIAELEMLSGTKLFLRHPRGLSLTYEGHRFLAHCRNILSSVKDAAYAFDRPDSTSEGSITLAITSTLSAYFLAPLLSRFQKAFPNLAIKLIEESRGAIEQRVLRDHCDLALLLVSNLAENSTLSSYTLIHSMRRLWLSPKHPLLDRDAITLAEVALEPYIQLTIDGAEESTFEYWNEHGLEPNVVFRTQSVESVRSLIAFGHGVTILSDLMYRPWSLEGDRVEVRELFTPVPTMNAGLVWKRGQIRNPAAATFLKFCRAEYGNISSGVPRALS